MNSCWCLECEAIPLATCEGQHSIIDRKEDVDGIKILLTQVASTFSLAADIRKKINGHLQTVIAANDESLQKLVSLADKKQLMAGKTDTVTITKNLKEVLIEAQRELKEAEKLWIQVNGNEVRNRNNLFFNYFSVVMIYNSFFLLLKLI